MTFEVSASECQWIALHGHLIADDIVESGPGWYNDSRKSRMRTEEGRVPLSVTMASGSPQVENI